jgi:vacuolar protein sorting-associated protein 13A/C
MTTSESGEDVNTRIAPEKLIEKHSIQFVFDLKLHGIGISMITKNAQEMLFVTLKEIYFKFTDSNIYQSIRLGIQWIQVMGKKKKWIKRSVHCL